MPVKSFAPLLPDRPKLLVVGSAPGDTSIRLGQYYAHRRNAFWRIAAGLLGLVGPPETYAGRVAMIESSSMALWDVLAECRRSGSLDGNIEAKSEKPNDIAGLLVRYPGIAAIGCNGQKAAQALHRHILPGLPEEKRHLRVCVLPSTSPAHAGMTLKEKYRIWHRELAPFLME